MPRIPDDLAHSISFLYRTRAEAEANSPRGGTAFLVGKPIDGFTHPHGGTAYLVYAVSNFHVVWTANAPVMRLHRRDGRKHILDLAKTDWVPHPDGDDLVATFLSDRDGFGNVDRAMDHLRFLETTKFITPEIVKKYDVGPGDDVFMFGRFLNHQGSKDSIAPALRAGNVSMMPQPIWNKTINADQLSFAVEMRSRTGFSGSPVAVYRTELSSPFRTVEHKFWWFLGINWGFILEKGTDENTWLNGVIPAWKILELLEEPALKDKHDEATENLKKAGTNDEAAADGSDDQSRP